MHIIAEENRVKLARIQEINHLSEQLEDQQAELIAQQAELTAQKAELIANAMMQSGTIARLQGELSTINNMVEFHKANSARSDNQLNSQLAINTSLKMQLESFENIVMQMKDYTADGYCKRQRSE